MCVWRVIFQKFEPWKSVIIWGGHVILVFAKIIFYIRNLEEKTLFPN